MINYKHVDFEVDNWREFQRSPEIVGFSFRPTVFRSGDLRPTLFRPAAGTGGVSISQSPIASFPDRPGVGLLVSMATGEDMQYVEHSLPSTQTSLHIRIMMSLATLTGGSVVILQGVDDQNLQTFTVTCDSNLKTITVTLSTSETISSSLLTELAWHCIELRIDTVGNAAELWTNGVSKGTSTGSFGSLATKKIRLGSMFKDTSTAGDLYLDEWVVADSYIGPVVITPTSLHADDPARWLVVYNTAELDSVAWVDSYRNARGVPYANLFGLDLSANETINSSEWTNVVTKVNAYLSSNYLEENVLGILLGYHVPGYVDSDGLGFIDAIPALLHHTDTTPLFNPLSYDGIPIRPAKDNLVGFKLTARIDAPDLTSAQTLISRATELMGNGLGDESLNTLWFDPYTNSGSGTDPQIAEMTQWSTSVDRMKTHLPIILSAESDPGIEVQFDQIQNDGFFWGWSEAAPSTNFFGTPSGSRIFCFQLHTVSATARTIRGTPSGNWAEKAMEVGYVAAAGSSRGFSLTAVPHVRPFFEALRLGWTLAEAWFVANPVPGEGLFLVGDPLLTVPLSKAGWEVYGPANRLEDINPALQSVVLRESETSVVLENSLRPSLGSKSVYLLRHRDEQGRSELGSLTVTSTNFNFQSLVRPFEPVWPDIDEWPISIKNGMANLSIFWERSIRNSRVETIELESEIEGGTPSILQVWNPSPSDQWVQAQINLPQESTRYRWRIYANNGTSIETLWSTFIHPVFAVSAPIQVVGM